METVTKREIDTLKDYFSSHRQELSDEQITKMEQEFIDKVRTYKFLYPHHTKTLQRWRNWYKIVKDDLHKKYAPNEVLFYLEYIYDTFRVENSDKGIAQLQKWYNNKILDNGYCLSQETIDQINEKIAVYGCKFNP